MSRRSRVSKGKKIRPTFFVFCEGETEEQYITYLRSKYRIPIVLDAKIAGNRITKTYIENYKKGKPGHEKDRDYLVYDIDAPRMLEKLQKIPDVELIASNPCFEIWLLMHFQEQKGELNSRECEEKLAQHIGNYKKGEINKTLRKQLDSKQEKAVNRACKLKAYKNPSTRVHHLIKAIEMAKEG